MRILHTIYDDVRNPWLGGGGAVRAFEICRRLAGRHDVTLLCGLYPGAAREEARDGVRILRVGTDRSYAASRLAYSARASREVARIAHDLWVYSFSAYAPLFAPCGRRRRSVLEFFHLMRGHASRKHPVAGIPARIAESAALRRYDHIIAISPSVRDAIARIRGSEGLHLVYTGIDTSCFAEPEESDYILYFGRLDIYNKGLDILLRAWSEVAPDFPDRRLLIAGRGTDRARREVERQARELGVESRLFLRGAVSDQEKPDVFRRALFTCMPSRFEGWGITAVEAGAAGRAVLGTRIPGLMDAIRDEVTGLLAPPDDAAAFAHGMRRLLSDAALRRRLGEEGRKRASRFTWDRIAADQEAVYAAVVGSRRDTSEARISDG